MADIHPTAIVAEDAELAEDVSVGPYCVIGPRVRIGAGTRLISHVGLDGPLQLGARNTLYPFCTLGFAPQHLDWSPDRAGAGLVTGDDNVFRESVTISRAASDEAPTRIGNDCLFMANSHGGHDCQVGNGCVVANGALLAGSVILGDRVVVGGNVAIHQFCRVGRGAMLSGTMGLNKDLPPFFMLTGGNIAGSINVIGMRRGGMPSDQIDDVKWVYKTLYRRGHTLKQALAVLEERAERPIVAEYLDFLRASKRGICAARGEARRGTGAD